MKRIYLALFFVLLASPTWAFPDNAVLDAFTGADNTTPPNANWTNAALLGATSANVEIDNNAATTATSSTEACAYWDTTSFNAAAEAYGDVVNIASTDYVVVSVRLQNIGALTTDGYEVFWQDAGNTVGIERIDNGVPVSLATPVSQIIAIGDKFGIRAVGDQVCSWFYDASGAATWVQLQCVTDATYPLGGFIGMCMKGSNTVEALDNFGGGNAIARRSAAPLMLE